MKSRCLVFSLATLFFLNASSVHALTPKQRTMAALAVGEGIAIAGAIASGVLFGHYSGSQYVLGVWCDPKASPKMIPECCSKLSDGSINPVGCVEPTNADPIACPNNTYAQCLEISYKNFTVSPSTRYTDEANSARLGTGIGIGISILLGVVVFPALLVCRGTQPFPSDFAEEA